MTALRIALFAGVAALLCAQTPKASETGSALLSAGLDPTSCYRVRNLDFSQEDAQFYLNDGYLIFGKPVNGAPVTAVFTSEVEGGDAEVLMLPPNRAERRSLAGYTGKPNLNEHFTTAVFLFTDKELRNLAGKLDAKPEEEVRKSPEMGAALADQWSRTVNNLAGSFESRMTLDLLSSPEGGGFFQAIIRGRTLGNFDIGFDGRGYEQMVAGQVNDRNGVSFFDTWMSFIAKSRRDSKELDLEEQILSYNIDATLDSSFVLHCITKIKFRATSESRNVLPFDLSAQMRTTGATLDGVPVEVYERDSLRNGLVQNSGNELVLVIPPQPLSAGSEHEVEIRHEGKVVVDAGRQIYFVNSRGTWYPNRGAQFANYDATFHYPKALDLVSSGRVVEDRIEGDVHTTRRVPEGRIRLLAFNLGVYDRKTVQHGALQIEVSASHEIEAALKAVPRQPDAFALEAARNARFRNPRSMADIALPPEAVPLTSTVDPATQLAKVADDIAGAFEFYRSRFGEPPLNTIEVSPVPGRFGQGFSGMIYMSTLSYLPNTVRPISLMPAWEQLFYGELLRAHEAAHQWWGNTVTTGSYRHEWLMEALANYSALMYLESKGGQKVVDTLLTQYKVTLLAKGPDGEIAEQEGPIVEGRRLDSSNNPSAWTAIAYGKGTWIFHMLRKRMGDAAFTKMLAEIRHRYEWKTIDTEQFRELAAEFMPKDAVDARLENFFDQWIYGTGIPALKLTYSVKGKPGAYKLTGTLTQTGVPDDFSVTVPIEIQTGKGKVIKQLQSSSEPVPFTIPVTVLTAKAVLDPGSAVLRR